MNEFAAFGGRAGGEVIFLNKAHAESARSGIQRNTKARNATAHHKYVKLFGSQPGNVVCAHEIHRPSLNGKARTPVIGLP